MDRLPFALHAFRRVTWVSESLKTEWAPLLEQIKQNAVEVFSTAAAEGLLPLFINKVSAGETYAYKRKMYDKGLYAEQLPHLPEYLQMGLTVNTDAAGNFVISGQRREVVTFIENIHTISALEEITGLPSGTLGMWNKLFNSGLHDIEWAYLQETADNNQPVNIFVTENNMLNPCWRTFGIAAIPYCPVSTHCGKSLALAARLRSLAEDTLSLSDYNAFYEVLSWPAEWTALHGITELKTPLFKITCNTVATATKYTIQYLSQAYPSNGAHGLLFPYKTPARLHVSASEKFSRGLTYINKTAGREHKTFFTQGQPVRQQLLDT